MNKVDVRDSIFKQNILVSETKIDKISCGTVLR